jgi:hypothetical protein
LSATELPADDAVKAVPEVKVMCRNIKTLYNFEPP